MNNLSNSRANRVGVSPGVRFGFAGFLPPRAATRPGGLRAALVFAVLCLFLPGQAPANERLKPGLQAVVQAWEPHFAKVARALPTGGSIRAEAVEIEGLGLNDLELTRFEVFASDVRVMRGRARVFSNVSNAYFRGKVRGIPNSVAVLSVPASGRPRGLVQTPEGTWYIGDRRFRALDMVGRRMREREFSQLPRFQCGAEMLPPVGDFIPPIMSGAPLADNTAENMVVNYTARVAVETDYEFFALFGDETRALEYIGDLFAYVSSIYEREIGTSLKVSYVRLWPDGAGSDPWSENSGLSAVLSEFREYWNENMSPVDRTLTHMLSGKRLGGGIAYVDVLCNANYGYGVSTNLFGNFDINSPSLVWDVLVVSHEIGHNFGSQHTHCYEGTLGEPDAIDHCYGSETANPPWNQDIYGDTYTCHSGARNLPGLDSTSGGSTGQRPGTIMSYCHGLGGSYDNISLTFGSQISPDYPEIDHHPYGRAAWRVPTLMYDDVVARAQENPSCLEFIGGSTFSVTPSAGTGGSVNPSTVQTVVQGATASFSVTSDEGYIPDSVVGGTCPQGSWSDDWWTTGAIEADCTVDFGFNAVPTFTVSPSAGTGGRVSPSAAQTVNQGATSTFTVMPDAGYARNDTVGGTCPQGDWNGDSWTTGAIDADCTVSFDFTATYRVTPSAGPGGLLSPTTVQTVNEGARATFMVFPIAGYTRDDAVGGTCPQGSWNGNGWTTGVIVDDCSVSFSFTPITLYVVTPSAGPGGSVSPSTAQGVAPGATASFTATPDTGYMRSDTVGGTCPQGGWNGDSWTTGTIDGDCTVSFSFSALGGGGDPDPLAEAVDNPVLTFATGGGAPWFEQTGESYDGGSAVQGGDIGHRETTWLETTVTGPGELSFFWRVSSERRYDYLRFYINGTEQSGSISGEVDWQQKNYSLGAGSHTLRWAYTKDSSANRGRDTGWVDQVSFTGSGGGGGPDPDPDPDLEPLAEALDNPALNVDTGGDAAWFGQTAVSYYAGDAAQSGDIDHGDSTWLETTVTGPGDLSFYWRVSSEYLYDYLRFYVDGSEQSGAISGEVDWQQVTYPIGAGTHTLRWAYTKDFGLNRGSDTGWVDRVVFTPALPSYAVMPSAGTGGGVSPSAAQTVNRGATTSFTVTPDAGYTRDDAVGGSCPRGGWSGDTWTTGAIGADCTVSFSFTAVPTYAVTPSAGTGGSVSPSSVQTVMQGTTASFTVTPDAGHTRDDAVGGSCPQGAWSGDTWTTGAIGANCTVSFSFSVLGGGGDPDPDAEPLAEAVDNPALSFATGGEAVWYEQTGTSYFGGDAAQGGDISHRESTWLETTVTGPGELSFYWRVSSERRYDYLRFYIDGVEQSGAISGEVNWQRKTYSIEAGSHSLRWVYTKDRSSSRGSDTGWVDKVEFTP